VTDAVQQQYEAYPYPARDPAEEAQRLITGSPSFLPEVNHYLFAGRRDFRQPFRALIAGGGTGDGLIQLAQFLQLTTQQLGGPQHEVVYLDVSAASRRIAEERAAARGLTNIRFLTGSLLDIARLAPGPYDYIESCGVLHHLPVPAIGLACLATQLGPKGGLGLMLYGSYGRDGVYPLQAALRQLLPEDAAPEEKVALARRLLNDLPEGNAFRRNPFLNDHNSGDAGLYDLLLHAQDRAYTVPEIVELLDSSDLEPVAFIEPCRYDPLSYLKDPDLREAAAALPQLEQAALAERLCGSLKTHVLYAAPRHRAAACIAWPDDPALIPGLRGLPHAALAASLEKTGKLVVTFERDRLELPALEGAGRIAALIDGRRTLGEIAAALDMTWPAFQDAYAPLHALLTGVNRLYLRL